MSEILLQFRPHLHVKTICGEEISLEIGDYNLYWHRPGISLKSCLECLLEEGASEKDLAMLWMEGDNSSLFEFYYFLENLKRQGLLCYKLQGEKTIATLLPSLFENVSITSSKESFFKWTEEATLRHVAGNWTCESHLSSCRVIVYDPQFLMVILALGKKKDWNELQKEMEEIPKDTLLAFLSFLQTAHLLVTEERSLSFTLSDCINKAGKLCHAYGI